MTNSNEVDKTRAQEVVDDIKKIMEEMQEKTNQLNKTLDNLDSNIFMGQTDLLEAITEDYWNIENDVGKNSNKMYDLIKMSKLRENPFEHKGLSEEDIAYLTKFMLETRVYIKSVLDSYNKNKYNSAVYLRMGWKTANGLYALCKPGMPWETCTINVYDDEKTAEYGYSSILEFELVNKNYYDSNVEEDIGKGIISRGDIFCFEKGRIDDITIRIKEKGLYGGICFDGNGCIDGIYTEVKKGNKLVRTDYTIYDEEGWKKEEEIIPYKGSMHEETRAERIRNGFGSLLQSVKGHGDNPRQKSL